MNKNKVRVKITDLSTELNEVQITDLSDKEALRIIGGNRGSAQPPTFPWNLVPSPIPCPPNPNG